MVNAAVPVYVNARRVEVPDGSTVLDAVRAWSADAARDVSLGCRAVTDSRGLPAPLDARVYGGAVFRVSAARARTTREDRFA
jgi:hypothetical protein